ncbi:MAG: serine hydrolase domain-containing protein [Nocardioides sp.]
MSDGTCAADFAPLRNLFDRCLEDGSDAGASIALVQDGELLVDLWGGQARPGVAWTHDTLVQVWSVTKTMVGLAVLVLADRGELDLDAPVASYWPDFAAAGKGDVRVRHVLGHTSGVPGWTPPLSVEELVDLEHSEAILAAEAPWYEPGSAPAYQMIDHGHLLDAIVRGATGRPLAEVLHEDVVEPLGGGFHLGVPESLLDNCADLIAPPKVELDPDHLPTDFLIRTILNPALSTRTCNSSLWRRSAVGGAGGHGTARGVAQVQAVVSHGGEVGGVRLLSEAAVDRIWEVQSSGTDLVLDVPLTFGLGYALATPAAPALPTGRMCWWTGYGGAIVVNDADTRTTFVYAPNRLVDHLVSSPRTDAYVRTAFDCVGTN